MFTFCDVFHETKQKRKQTLDSGQYGLEIIPQSYNGATEIYIVNSLHIVHVNIGNIIN